MVKTKLEAYNTFNIFRIFLIDEIYISILVYGHDLSREQAEHRLTKHAHAF